MFNCFAKISSSLSITTLKSIFTRWIAGFISPLFVKNWDISSPLIAFSAISSADSLFLLARFFIEHFLSFRRFPERDKVIIFSFLVFSDFIYHWKKLSFHPSNRTKLLWIIRTKVHIVWMWPDFLDLYKTDTSSRINSKLFTLLGIKFKSHAPIDITVIPSMSIFISIANHPAQPSRERSEFHPWLTIINAQKLYQEYRP